MAEFPFVQSLSKKYNQDLKVIFVSADWLDEEKQVIDFLNLMDVNGQSYIKDQSDEEFINGFHKDWTGSLPFTIVYGKLSGEMVDYWENSKYEKRFIEAVEKAINS